MKTSDLAMVFATTTLLKPCFFKNKDNTDFASSFSAANKIGGTTVELNEPFPEEKAAVILKHSVNILKSTRRL